MAGIVRVELAAAWSIEKLRRAGGKVVSLELTEGAGWRRLDFAKADYNETGERGESRKRTLKMVMPISEGGEVLEGIEELAEERWVVRMTDGRGVRWIIGDEQEPLVLTWSRTNAGEANGKYEIVMQLESEGRWGAMELREQE
jgi:hypothetical protein